MFDLHPRLLKVFSIIRPGIPVPTIVQLHEQPGQTRARELASYGAEPTYIGRYVPQIHADMDEASAKALAHSGLKSTTWYDEPHYAFASPFRSTPAEIQARVEERVRRNTTGGNPHPVASSTIRAHLGAGRPKVLNQGDGIYTLEDVRVFTKSKDVYDSGLTGKGVRVGVLDTGADETNPMLEGQIDKQLSFVSEDAKGDGQGHGTWCASAVAGKPTVYDGKIEHLRGKIIQGMAPDARLVIGKVLTSEGSGSTSGVIQGMEAMAAEGVDVISMSLGSLFGGAGRTPDSQTVNELSKRGVHMVVAAGNSFGWLTVGSPGSATGAITVASIAMKQPSPGIVASFSSKGPTSDGRIKPTIAAPGGNIRPGEVILAATAGAIAKESMDGGWGLLRGTSMATPCVAGIFAQMVQDGLPRDRATVEEILAVSVRGAIPGFRGTRLSPKNNRTGWGPLDAVQMRESMHTRAGPLLRLYSHFMDSRSRPLTGAGLDIAAMAQRLPSLRPDELRLSLV